jgi:hypothetical protein
MLMPRRRLPPPSDGLLSAARRYANSNAVRAFGAFLAVIAVVVLAGLAWLWLFGA